MMLAVFILFVACLSTTSSTPVSELAADASARIVNGHEVDITEVPFQVSLRRRVFAGWAHVCGGAIISRRAVLTAGHCVYGYDNEPTVLKIVAGTASRLTGGTAYDISRVIIHQSYDPSTLENDIAMLETSRVMTFSDSVNAIRVAPHDYDLPDGSEALVSGFGTTSYEGSVSLVLLATKVVIVNQDACSRTYLRMATITRGMLCAGGSDPPRDACQGDSGGPLVSNNQLIGIVSWGEGCADQIYPGVYTRVSKYTPWIEQIFVEVFN